MGDLFGLYSYPMAVRSDDVTVLNSYPIAVRSEENFSSASASSSSCAVKSPFGIKYTWEWLNLWRRRQKANEKKKKEVEEKAAKTEIQE